MRLSPADDIRRLAHVSLPLSYSSLVCLSCEYWPSTHNPYKAQEHRDNIPRTFQRTHVCMSTNRLPTDLEHLHRHRQNIDISVVNISRSATWSKSDRCEMFTRRDENRIPNIASYCFQLAVWKIAWYDLEMIRITLLHTIYSHQSWGGQRVVPKLFEL